VARVRHRPPLWQRMRHGKREHRAHAKRGLAGDVAPVAPHRCAYVGDAPTLPLHVLQADTAVGNLPYAVAVHSPSADAPEGNEALALLLSGLQDIYHIVL
jgi:hypothetical protein